ncbi:MAG: type II secretion system protein GspJ [Pseudobdellovibrionaceae bacterium]
MISRNGFTLLEVMIVLVIMATLSVLSSQSIQQAIKNKIKLQTQVQDMSEVRDALKVIERDVNLAFHYTDLETELKDMIKKKRVELSKGTGGTLPGGITTTTTTQPGTPLTAVYNPNDPNDPLNKTYPDRIDPATHFVGHENEMFFATLNSSRLNEGSQQADFIKVGYLLQSCKKPGQETSSKSCLVRKSSNVVEGDITKQEDGVILLTDVSEFKMRYYGKGKQDWANDWDTAQGDGIAKNRFPDAVEISLTVEKGATDKKKKISMQLVVPIRFPNNYAQDAANSKAEQKAQNQNNGYPGGVNPNDPTGGGE